MLQFTPPDNHVHAPQSQPAHTQFRAVLAYVQAAWALMHGLCDISQPGCSGALFTSCQGPTCYSIAHIKARKKAKSAS